MIARGDAQMGLSWGEREGGRYPDAIPFASGRRAPLFDAASEACEQERKATKPYSAIRARASAFGTEALRCRPPGAGRLDGPPVGAPYGLT